MSFNPGSYTSASVIWSYDNRTLTDASIIWNHSVRTLTQFKAQSAEDTTEQSTGSGSYVDFLTLTITAPPDKHVMGVLTMHVDIKVVDTNYGPATLGFSIEDDVQKEVQYNGTDYKRFFYTTVLSLRPGETVTVKIKARNATNVSPANVYLTNQLISFVYVEV